MLHQKRSRLYKLYIRFFIVAIVIFFLLNQFGGESVKKTINFIAYPFLKIRTSIITPISSAKGYFFSKAELYKKVDSLEKDIDLMRLENARVVKLEEENIELRKLFEYKEKDQQTILSRVISRPPFSDYDTLIIEISNRDINIGAEVISDNIKIGKIKDKYNSTALVKLYSAYNEEMPVLIGDNIEGLAKGQGGGSFKVQLPRDVSVKKDDPIYLSSDSKKVISLISYIDINERDTFQYVYFSWPFSLSQIDYVLVTK
jgi:cell shape-determining protein MreC